MFKDLKQKGLNTLELCDYEGGRLKMNNKSSGVNGVNGWKVTAIIFIILFLLETIAVVGIMSVGVGEINKETECANDICQTYDAYQYYSDTCYCYRNNEVAYTKYMK